MTKTYKTEIYNNVILVPLFSILVLLLGVYLFIYFGKLYHVSLFSFWLPALLLFVPFLFSKTIKKNFMERYAVLNFNNTGFSVTQFSLKTNEKLMENLFLWVDIENYKFYFDTKNNTCLTLYLKNRNTRSFIFKDNKTFDEAINQESVFSNFYGSVKELLPQQKILPRPGLLATNTGKVIIIFQSILIAIALIISIFYFNFSKSYYLILAFGFIIPQLINRNQNKNVYDKLCKLD